MSFGINERKRWDQKLRKEVEVRCVFNERNERMLVCWWIWLRVCRRSCQISCTALAYFSNPHSKCSLPTSRRRHVCSMDMSERLGLRHPGSEEGERSHTKNRMKPKTACWVVRPPSFPTPIPHPTFCSFCHLPSKALTARNLSPRRNERTSEFVFGLA